MHGSLVQRPDKGRSLLEALPQSTYRALPNARATADLCSNAVARAVQFRNPRIIAEWLDYELNRVSTDILMTVLDTAIDVELDGATDANAVSVAARIVAESRDYLAEHDSAPTTARPASNVDSTIDGVLATIASFDERLHRHSMDVAGTAIRLATSLKCSDEDVTVVWNAARAHEIGRLRIGADVANSSRRLDESERSAIRLTLGDVRGLRTNAALQNVANVIEEAYIAPAMIASRPASILRVADSFHSICEKRPYRPGLDPESALKEVCRERGTIFDGIVVDALVAMLGYGRSYAWSA